MKAKANKEKIKLTLSIKEMEELQEILHVIENVKQRTFAEKIFYTLQHAEIEHYLNKYNKKSKKKA